MSGNTSNTKIIKHTRRANLGKKNKRIFVKA